MKLQLFIVATALNLIASMTIAQTGQPATKSTAAQDTTSATREKLKIEKIEKSDAEWRRQLTRMQYKVTRQAGTERAFTGKYWKNKRKGTYLCVCCDLELFSSQTKFKSGTGWPSFYAPIDKEHVSQKIDRSLISFGPRVEILCTRCDAHLGHVFDDGPPPTGLRYCMNSAALKFETAAETKKRKEQEEQAKDAELKEEEKENDATSADSNENDKTSDSQEGN